MVEGQTPKLAGTPKKRFQSAVRISVWLKPRRRSPPRSHLPVSIRRADLCLVEDSSPVAPTSRASRFQSAVRISVWLKVAATLLGSGGKQSFQSAVRISVWLKAWANERSIGIEVVSIRRADLCLVEATTVNVWHCRVSVSIRRADLCLVEDCALVGATGAGKSVSIRRADLCLVEARPASPPQCPGRSSFNPPCGSLFG